MADQPHSPSSTGAAGSGPGSATDPISAFWRDVWARYSAGGAPQGMPPFGMGPDSPFAALFGGMAGGGAPPTPEALRRMQAAFYDAMAQYAEQYMRSPQFLESMKRSMDQALAFRQQMDSFLKSNMASAFEAASGGANSEVLGAIRQLSTRIDERLGEIDARLGALEAGDAKPAKRPSSRGARS